MFGRNILQMEDISFTEGDNNLQLPLFNIPSGIYSVVFNSAAFTCSAKLVISH